MEKLPQRNRRRKFEATTKEREAKKSRRKEVNKLRDFAMNVLRLREKKFFSSSFFQNHFSCLIRHSPDNGNSLVEQFTTLCLS